MPKKLHNLVRMLKNIFFNKAERNMRTIGFEFRCHKCNESNSVIKEASEGLLALNNKLTILASCHHCESIWGGNELPTVNQCVVRVA